MCYGSEEKLHRGGEKADEAIKYRKDLSKCVVGKVGDILT